MPRLHSLDAPRGATAPALEQGGGARAELPAPGISTGQEGREHARALAAQRQPVRVPDATYRLQFNRHFTFQQAASIAGYLQALGISDVYASPLFRATPESTHGYDVCQFEQFSPDLGSPEDFARLARRLQELGLGLLLDMVPNHMAADTSNGWWLDVLEKGPFSQYAAWFDIDWQPLKSDLHDKVLLPVLEDHYAKVLEAGKLNLALENGAFVVVYYDRRFPVSPHSYRALLLEILRAGPPPSECLEDLRQLLAEAPDLCADDSGMETFKRRLRNLQETSREFRERAAALLARFNGRQGDPRSFNELDRLLRGQHYRLAYWRVGSEEINYRRFFDVSELVSLRVELPQVFESTHGLLDRLLREGSVTGLRIDHPDGLWNPKQYFERLQAFFGMPSAGCEEGSSAPLYIVAEKILTGGERLPSDWPVAGTTGYDFLNRVNGLFVHRAQAAAFDKFYREFTGLGADFDSMVHAGKMKILRESLISEHLALAQRLKAIAVDTRAGQDITFRQLHSALGEIIAAFPVYRTYITEETRQVPAPERDYIMEAVQLARARNPLLESAAYDFIQRLLLLDWPAELTGSAVGRCHAWVMEFQQLTGPVMAKGLEDTVFYNFNRLISLNEVGGHPGAFGGSVAAFHEHNRLQADFRPHGLLATATHDTKRGEDVRARINVLSEIAGEWRQAVLRWAEMNVPFKSIVDGSPAPHPNDEYLFYQTLVGAWLPESATPEGVVTLRARMVAYMMKALKEAKARTSWTNPNSAYEEATTHFVESVLSSAQPNAFLADFVPFQRQVAFFGVFNSLSQLLLKLTSPGVPDFYQGTELWDFNLVDPDNRRCIDFALRDRMVTEIMKSAGQDPAAGSDLHAFLDRLLAEWPTGAVKLYVTWRILQWRRAHPHVFKWGDYTSIDAEGARRDHVCAFERSTGEEQILTLVPRLVLTLTGGTERPPQGEDIWGDTRVLVPGGKPGDKYQNILTGECLKITQSGLQMAEALASFPVALLTRQRKTKQAQRSA